MGLKNIESHFVSQIALIRSEKVLSKLVWGDFNDANRQTILSTNTFVNATGVLSRGIRIGEITLQDSRQVFVYAAQRTRENERGNNWYFSGKLHLQFMKGVVGCTRFDLEFDKNCFHLVTILTDQEALCDPLIVQILVEIVLRDPQSRPIKYTGDTTEAWVKRPVNTKEVWDKLFKLGFTPTDPKIAQLAALPEDSYQRLMFAIDIFPLQLVKSDQLLEHVVSIDGTQTTWRERITNHPILLGSGPILPRSFPGRV